MFMCIQPLEGTFWRVDQGTQITLQFLSLREKWGTEPRVNF